jgi:hypothetical protein
MKESLFILFLITMIPAAYFTGGIFIATLISLLTAIWADSLFSNNKHKESSISV